jgi:hypothetical protein
MGKAKTWTYVILAAIVIFFIWGFTRDSGPGEHDAFAQCLTDSGFVMYGTDWCPHCKDQKARFGKSFGYVNYINCDKSKEICNAEGIQGYPTWKGAGKSYPGVQPLQGLASLSGCSLEDE